jgi:hypothetical protein
MTDERKEQIRSIANSMRKQPFEVSMENACYIANMILDLLAEIERLEAQKTPEIVSLRDQFAIAIASGMAASNECEFVTHAYYFADKAIAARSKGDE